jgi:hypothetical protein
MTRHLLGALCLFLLVRGAAPAFGMSYPVALDLTALATKAERIVVGRVMSRAGGRDSLGLPATVYRLRVERVLKGRAPRRLVIKQFGVPVAIEDPATGVVTFPIDGMPVYAPGRRYLLFLNGTSDVGFTSPVGLAIGAFEVLPGDLAQNGLRNAGLGLESRGPLPLARLVRETRRRVRRLPGDHRAASSLPPESAARYQTIVDQGLQPRPLANPGALFNGNVFRWNVPSADNPGGTLAAVPWDVETGTLGSASNAAAKAAVAAAFAKWSAPSTTTIVISGTPGSLGIDVDNTCPGSTCYSNFYFGVTDGLSPVIFDNDGSITNALTGSFCGFGGQAGFHGSTSDGGLTWTLEGAMVLDGAWLGGVCGSLSLADFGTTITHEAGHFLGLGHVVVNGELVMNNEPYGSFGVPPCASVEMMLSNAIPGCVRPNVLQKDDIASISQLYPSASFAATTAAITGHVYASDGSTAVNCGNVILRNDADPFFDAVGGISGISKDFGTPPAGQPGLYRARGLTSGADYLVSVNQIPAFATGGSGLTSLCNTGPPTLPGPEEHYNAAGESANPAIDNPDCYCPVTATGTVSGIDMILNSAPGSGASCGGPPCGTIATTTTTTITTTTTSTTTTTVIAAVGHLKCYKIKDARAKASYTLDLLANVPGFANELGCTLKLGAKEICVEVGKQNVSPPPPGGGPASPPNAGSVFLSYGIKCAKPTLPAKPFVDQFGSGSFVASKASTLLVPALPGPANDHFKCYKTKDPRPKASYTADLLAGVAGFANELGCTIKLGAKRVCVQVSKQNVTPAPPGGGPGPGPGSGAKFLSYKLKCPKGVLPPASFTDQFGAGTFTPGSARTLLVPAS